MLGGGMRQAGVIAAAGLYALKHHLPLLKEDHRRARELARGLAGLSGISLLHPEPATNMVYLKLESELPYDAAEIKKRLQGKGIQIGYENLRLIRLVTHIWIQDQDIPLVIAGFKDALS